MLPELAPNTSTSLSIRGLGDSTTDLVDSLNSLSDTVHIMRETSVTASRRLRGVREALREWRVDNNLREEGLFYLEQGGWDQRLHKRECASVCNDVLRGFEDVCNSWRERLVSQEAGSVVM